MPKRSSLGFALIAKDAEQTLGACLKSIRPYCEQIVVCVDERTTDKTAKVARKHGAEVYPVKVADWHECEQHGKVLAQHFANARNESFTHLDPALTWWGWIDADDTLKGGEELADVLAVVPDDHVGTWHPYHYATINDGAITSTVFHRERILRANVGWKWEFRVHEVVTPKRPGGWLKVDNIAWYHQEGVHRSDNSAARNLLLLEIDYEQNPRESRTLFYLGNQYFALNRFADAAHWYEQLASLQTAHRDAVNNYEVWQAHVYRSMSYERLGNLDMALRAAWDALDCVPAHPEPYFRLGAVYAMAGEPDKAIFWTQLGRQMAPPPFFVFKNPLDYSFNHHLPMADALAQQGRISEARQELEEAIKVYPAPQLEEPLAGYRKIEQTADGAKWFREWARYSLGFNDGGNEVEVIERYEALPGDVKSVQSVRDLVVPVMLKWQRNTQPRIAFWCGRSMEEWAPPKINETGIGGSETAVVEIARRFASDGWRVDVYNGAGRYEGVYEDVGYWEPQRIERGDVDVFVSWRQPAAAPASHGVRARASALWCHDLNYGPDEGAMLTWSTVLGVSEWHAKYLSRAYGINADYVPNGIDLSRFHPAEKRKAWQAIYASSPDRGLLQLLGLWKRIAEGEPGAKLLVAYGWDNVDKAIESGRSDLAAFKRACQDAMANAPGVEFLGRIPQDRLADLYSESTAWLYPTNFLETSCISAMEAMAGGCIPVTSAAGALPGTIAGAGVVLDGQPHSFPWQELYVRVAKGLLSDHLAQQTYRRAALDRAKLLTWDAAYERWSGIVGGLLHSEVKVAAA